MILKIGDLNEGNEKERRIQSSGKLFVRILLMYNTLWLWKRYKIMPSFFYLLFFKRLLNAAYDEPINDSISFSPEFTCMGIFLWSDDIRHRTCTVKKNFYNEQVLDSFN